MVRLLVMLTVIYNSFCNVENNILHPTANENIKKENSLFYEDITNKIKLVKSQCGKLCDIDELDYRPIAEDSTFYYVPIKKEVNCQSLWNHSIFDEVSKFKQARQKLPTYLQQYFTHNSSLVDIQPMYYDEIADNIWNDEFNTWAWTKEGIDQHVKYINNGSLNGLYGKDVQRSIKYLSEKFINVANKHVLVLGSTLPWIEALLLSMDVGHITVIDYKIYPSTHSKISTITPTSFSELVVSNEAPMFDAMVSFSSIEHSGLGRYGDQLNPWGDIIAMGRAWCQLKPGARALVGVPTGKDRICFNSARVYGSFLYQNLFPNWKQIYSEGSPRELLKQEVNCRTSHTSQPIHVLEK